jgi:hypothetical protein
MRPAPRRKAHNIYEHDRRRFDGEADALLSGLQLLKVERKVLENRRKIDDEKLELLQNEIPRLVSDVVDFQSLPPRDLWFERGEEIKILTEHKSGWWIGEIETTDESGKSGTRKGLFPESYVEKREALAGRPAAVDAIFLASEDFYDPSVGASRLVLVSGDLVMVDLVLKGSYHGTNMRTTRKDISHSQS